jgi:membrane-bound lytic murein transglycosylase D
MRLNKIGKLAICGIVSSLLLTGCDNSSALSVMRAEQHSLSLLAKSDSIWGNMGKHFQLDSKPDNRAVSQQIAYLQKNSQNLNAILKKAGPLITYVYAKTQQEGLPAELALLPIVESDYSPTARSPVGASGLWQIMPQTGRDLGLKNFSAYDGRKDIVASTHAALLFLKDLHGEFHNWELALAAYNWGPANIERIVKHNKPMFGNYWDLKRIPKETRDYVPKLYALAAVIKNPARYHIELPAISTEPQVAALKIAPKVDLKKIAQSTGISIETMRKLNPGYHALATTKGAPNTVLVPADKVEAIKPLIPVLAVATPKIRNDAEEAVKKATQDTVVNTLLKQGQWLIVSLAGLASTDAFANF